MPNSNNAAKRHRQNLKRRVHNRSIRSSVRTSIKTFEAAVLEKQEEKAKNLYAECVKNLDTASRKGLYHRNTAARKKSRMHRRLEQIRSSQ